MKHNSFSNKIIENRFTENAVSLICFFDTVSFIGPLMVLALILQFDKLSSCLIICNTLFHRF